MARISKVASGLIGGFFVLAASDCVHATAPKPEDRQGFFQGPTGPVEYRRRFITAEDGTRISYIVAGNPNGTPVMMIHGYYASAVGNWFENGVAQPLLRDYKVIAIDNRGHGESGKPILPTSYGARMWQDSIAVLRSERATHAHFHGYSMGGSILAQIWFHHPEMVLSAIFGGSGLPERSGMSAPADARGEDPEEAAAKSKLMNDYPHDRVALNALALNAPWSGSELQRIDLAPRQIPVMTINGLYDRPQAKSSRMKREVRDFQMVIIPGKSHLTTIMPNYISSQYIETTKAFVDRAESVRRVAAAGPASP